MLLFLAPHKVGFFRISLFIINDTVWMNYRRLKIQVNFIYLFAVPSIPQIVIRTCFEKKWMPKNDTSEILLVELPGNDKLCRIWALLDAVCKVVYILWCSQLAKE